jgi:hypothetical protein
MVLQLSGPSLTTAGILLLSLVAVEYGGVFMLRLATQRVPATEFQRTFFRAGHAHAGILVTLALVLQPFVSAGALTGGWQAFARSGVAAAAFLIPAGFFLGAAGNGRERPNRLSWLIAAGGVVLAAALVVVGIGLLVAERAVAGTVTFSRTQDSDQGRFDHQVTSSDSSPRKK